MKKIFSLLFGAVLALGTVAFAQDGSVKVNKDYYGPDDNGVYTLQLEAYVTGSINVETHPADFILVLDYSYSMIYDLVNLRTSVAEFVKKIQVNNRSVKKDKNGGHRVALVLFAGSVFSRGYSSDLNKLLDVSKLTVGTKSIQSNNVDLIGYSYAYGTNSTDAMTRAQSILSSAAQNKDYTDSTVENEDGSITTVENSKRARFVVFFTDGEPNRPKNSTVDNMNETIAVADVIKSNSSYQGTIYSVGLFHDYTPGDDPDHITTFMRYVSSDETNKRVPTEYPYNYEDVTGQKSVIVSDSKQLEKIFDDIFEATGGSYSAASSSSVLVDIVTTSFNIPTNASLGSTQIYKVECTKNSATSLMTFEEDRKKWENITGSVALTADPATGKVTVTNYDYGAEWCGWDSNKNEHHGHKLVLEIPIMGNTDAVGGPDVATNAPGSQLIVKDKDGNQVGEPIEFKSPAISLPVNLHIMKKDLRSGESAKFSIYRTTVPVTSSSTWDYVTTVFVTNGESSAFEDIVEDGVTKSYPVTYVRGLPSAIKQTVVVEDVEKEVTVGYVYKIVEDDWSWSYDFKKATGIGPGTVQSPQGVSVTVTDKNDVTSDKFIKNPIIFWNDLENGVDQRVRHAESKATNIFLGNGSIIYDDSKKNTGTGRKDNTAQ